MWESQSKRLTLSSTESRWSWSRTPNIWRCWLNDSSETSGDLPTVGSPRLTSTDLDATGVKVIRPSDDTDDTISTVLRKRLESPFLGDEVAGGTDFDADWRPASRSNPSRIIMTSVSWSSGTFTDGDKESMYILLEYVWDGCNPFADNIISPSTIDMSVCDASSDWSTLGGVRPIGAGLVVLNVWMWSWSRVCVGRSKWLCERRRAGCAVSSDWSGSSVVKLRLVSCRCFSERRRFICNDNTSRRLLSQLEMGQNPEFWIRVLQLSGFGFGRVPSTFKKSVSCSVRDP